MKTTKIKIKNLFGISEFELDGRNVEVSGTNGTGKTSIIDSIRYALTNSSERDYIIKKGENEGEIIVETDTGLYINRKKRSEQSDYKSIKENGRELSSPESFLQQLFSPLQLDPVAFTKMGKKEQNRVVLDLIEFDWDLNWIKEKFEEIPLGVNYQQNILQVLYDIQSENGDYFVQRQNFNRDIRNKIAFIEDIAKDIPNGFQAEKWLKYDLGENYRLLAKNQEKNSKIERAKAFTEQYNNKIRGFEAEKAIAISLEEKLISNERESLKATIERLKAEISAASEKIDTLQDKLNDKVTILEGKYNEEVAKLNGDMQIANKYINFELIDCTELLNEVSIAEKNIKCLNEYNRMMSMKCELEELTKQSERLSQKIELARNLPGEILQTAKIPIKGFSVENGIPLINGLPISNLSEGEQLSLCVDVALSKPNSLQIILIDGAEKLSDENRSNLYLKCKEKGLQFIATKTSNKNEMEVMYL